MIGKSRFDISCENLDLYFAHELEKITPQAKDGLPRDLIFKIFRKGGEVNTTSTSKLSFISKLFILVKSLRKRWYLIIEDEESGIKMEDFKNISRLLKERDLGTDKVNNLMVRGGFLLGGKEVCDALQYLNMLSASPTYNYVMKTKNSVSNPTTEADKAVVGVTKFLIHYENCKKQMVSQTGLAMPEFYVLLYLYRGDRIQSSLLYHDVFKRAYQSSPTKVKMAFGTLQHKGYITKYGNTSKTFLEITPLGRSFFRGVMDKYVLNW